jgi:hypothetical protein
MIALQQQKEPLQKDKADEQDPAPPVQLKQEVDNKGRGRKARATAGTGTHAGPVASPQDQRGMWCSSTPPFCLRSFSSTKVNPTVMSQVQKMKIMKRTIIISQMIMRTMKTRKRPIGRGVWQR